MNSPSFEQEDYQAFQRFLENACGIVLGDNKHYLVNSRLSKLMRNEKIDSLGGLVKQLSAVSSPLKNQVIEAMTTNETLWFRDVFPFEILKQHVFNDFKERKTPEVKMLSAACSSGQEPYSISMIAEEFLQENFGSKLRVNITGIDIDTKILDEARMAKYEVMALSRGLSEERKRKFFTAHDHVWEVNPNIRARVNFREHNLMQNFNLLGKFDIVFCRNVLIYFSAELKTAILDRIAACLNPRGYLFLGASESLVQYSDKFEMVRTPQGVVYQLKS